MHLAASAWLRCWCLADLRKDTRKIRHAFTFWCQKLIVALVKQPLHSTATV